MGLDPFYLPSSLTLTEQAKDKEQAVLYLHRMYDLHPVIYGNLKHLR